MKSNTHYGKLNDGVIEYAPSALKIGNNLYCNPTEDQYLACGWLNVIEEKPQDKYYVPSGWEQRDGAIYRTYTDTPIIAPTKAYKVEDIIYGLIQAYALQGVKAIVGDYWELLTMRDTIEADNEIWTEVYPQLREVIISQGILTADQLDAILKEAEV